MSNITCNTPQSGNKWKSRGLLLLSFLIPAGIFMLSMLYAGAAPFGNNTTLLLDSVGQYIDFISYFKTVLRGENDLFYSFAKTLGGDFVGLASYYLLSPFNLLFLLSDNENIPLFYTAVTVLKLSACGTAFYWAAQKRFGAGYIHLLFSTAYALMAYNVLYQWNIMWLDGVIILPLLGLGLERLWEGKSSGLYIFSLIYALLTNFYIGYMLCIAAVLFSLVRLALHEGAWRQRGRLLGKFIFASGIGGFSTAFVWLPAFIAIGKGRAQFESDAVAAAINFNPLQLFSKLVAGAGGPAQLEYGLPHIFCGTAVLFLAILFFISARVPKKVRAAAFCALMFVTGSFVLRFADVAWHGFSPNNAFNYRYSFIWSYIIIMLAQYALYKGLAADGRACLFAAAPLVLMYLFLLVMDYEHVRTAAVGLGACVLLLLLLLVRLPDKRRLASVLLCVIGVAELGINCCMLLDGVVGETRTMQMSEWKSYIPAVTEAVDYVKAQDSGFYRMEKTFSRTHNDAMFHNYNGLSHFSSGERAFVPEFMEKMGFRRYKGVWAYYNMGSTAEVDSLLGVKYLLSKDDMAEQKGYELMTRVDDIGVYRNVNALPLALLSSQELMNLTMDGEDYFELHNRIWSALCGEDVEMLKPVEEYSVSPSNMEMSAETEAGTVYTRSEPGREASLRYELSVTEQMPMYLYFTAPDLQSVNLRINGEDRGAYFDMYRWDMAYIGSYEPGDTVTVELVAGEDTLTVENAYFYYEDMQALAGATEKLQAGTVTLQRQSGSHIEGQLTALQDGYIVFTIPYDTAWKLSIDGEPVQARMALDTFIAAQMDAGDHSFTLRYIPDGLYLGCGLSLLAAAALLIVVMKKRCRVSGNINSKENES